MDKELDLIKDNILKDRRRRYLYLSKDRKSGLQIMEPELALISILKKMPMWAVLVFIIPFGIFKLSLTMSLLIAGLVLLLGTLYFHLIVLKNRHVVELTQSEFDKLNKPEFIKAQKSNALSELLIPIFLILIVVSRALDVKAPLSPLDLTVAKVSIALFAAYSVYIIPKYLKFSKEYKALGIVKEKKKKKNKKD